MTSILKKTFVYLCFSFWFCSLISGIPPRLIPSAAAADGPDFLSIGERTWLNAHDGMIRIAPDPKAPPIEFFDKDGKFSGISSDYVRLLEEKLGTRFKIVRISSWREVIEKIRNREVDVLSAAVRTPQREEFLHFTPPYLTLPWIIIVRKEADLSGTLTLADLTGRCVTTVSGYATHDFLKKNWGKRLKILSAPNVTECLKLVSFGQCDATILQLATASYTIEKEGITNLHMAGKVQYTFNCGMAVRRDWPILNNILEKGLAQITKAEKQMIQRRWISLSEPAFILSRAFWKYLRIGGGLLAGILILILSWNLTLKKQVRMKTLEVRKSERELQSIIRATPDIIFRLNSAGEIIFLSDAAGKYGYIPVEWGGRKIREIFVRDEGGTVQDVIQELRNGEAGQRTFEVRLVPAGGDADAAEVRHFLMDMERLEDPAFFQTDGGHAVAGNAFIIQGIARDITKQKLDEAAILKNAEYHRRLFEDSPTALFIQDFSGVRKRVLALKKQGVEDLTAYLRDHPDEVSRMARMVNFTKANRAAVELYRAESEAELLADLDRVLMDDDRGHFIDQIAMFTEGRNWYEGEARNLSLRGDVIELIIRKAVIHQKERDLSRVLVSITDVTELNRAYKERHELESRLRQAHKMEAVGTLTGGIAHDFNNILGIMIGNTELAMDHLSENSKARENLGAVMSAGLRAKKVIRQLLNFTRKTDDDLHKPVALAPIVRETLSMMRATLPAFIQMADAVSDGVPPVMGEPTQIHQVLFNLCANAAHALREVGGVLKIELEPVLIGEEEACSHPDLSPGPYAKLSVSDTGCGIPPEILEKIFDPYFTTKPVGEGTGMGLAVVHGIVRNHGAAVSVFSEPGKGTRFDILFPVIGKAAPAETGPPETAPRGKNERILFIDDEPAIADVGKLLLEGLGYRVKSLMHPFEALDVFRDDPRRFDLVITDMTMPGVHGHILAAEMMKLRPDIPVIICTGYSEQLTDDRAAEPGVKGVIYKPLTRLDLARAVRKALDG